MHLPPWVEENVAKEEMVDDALAFARGYSKFLKELDEHLSLVFVKENVNDPALVAGRWHIRRRNAGTLDSYMAITTPDGGYREPNTADLDRLRERDAWKTGGAGAILERRHAKDKVAEKARELWHEQARDEVAVNYRAARRVAGDRGLERRMWGRGRKPDAPRAA
jgi:hypothetical protein